MVLEPTVEVALLIRFREGDETAFKSVYDNFYRRVYQYAYSYLKNREQTEEIVQETFLKIWINRDKLNEQLPLAPYLFTICHRLVLDAFRKAATVNALKANLQKANTETDNHTEEAIIVSDLKRFSERAIADLPKQQQLVFKLSRAEELTYEEIGERLNISKNTVRNHLVVALKSLRTQFESQGVVYVLMLVFLF